MPQGFLSDYADEFKEQPGDTPDTGIIDPSESLPIPREQIPNRHLERFGLGTGDGQVYRYTLAYRVEYPIGSAPSERGLGYGIGTIEIRTYTWLRSPELPTGMKRAIRDATHRAGHIYNSTIETEAYGGFLDGFNAAGGELTGRTETEGPEPVDAPASNVGATEWHLVIYDEDGDMRGHAAGSANIWRETQVEVPPEEPQHVAPHRWDITGGPSNRTDGRYQVAPEGGSEARRRYKAGAGNGKAVYINGHLIGRTGARGRVFVSNEYGHGNPTHGDNWSRRGILDDDDDATPQAFRHGGTLYMTGETPNEVHLSTAGALPDGFTAADADQVSVDQEVRPGSEGAVIPTITLRDPQDATPIRALVDEQVKDLMGYSAPPYQHSIIRGWRA